MNNLKPKHTPGPWKVYPDFPTTVCVNLREDAEKPEFYNWETIHESACSDSESKANARLIAATPEMLEALQIAMQRLDSPEFRAKHPSVELHMRKAIAKATGGAE